MPAATRSALRALVEARRGRNWVLFLDRDGVLNRRIEHDYVRTWAQFEFLPGALQAVAVLSRWAPQVVVVTNQQGVGKGLHTRADLDSIHDTMVAAAGRSGARIDSVLSCTHLAADHCSCRKPAAGLAERWLREHPRADPGLCVMVGDSPSDMAMATHLAATSGGCAAIGIGPKAVAGAGLSFPDLAALADALDDGPADSGGPR